MAPKVKVQAFKKYSPDYNKNSLRKAQDEYGMTAYEAKLIQAFMEDKKGDNLSEGRQRILYSKLSQIRKRLKVEYQNATIQDLKNYCDDIARIPDKETERVNTPHTCNETKSILKEFYRFLMKQNLTTITETQLAEIKKVKKVKSNVTEASLLTKADITAMMGATSNPMHKCLIALLAESGGRVSEVAMITWDQLKFDQHGVVFRLYSEKTQDYRQVRLIDSVPYLAAWKSLYQNYRDDSFVFVSAQGNTMVYETVRAIIVRIAKKAGLKKKVNPHLFRHSRVTELLNLGMREPELKKSLWGDVSTRMLSRYEHLAAKGSIDNEYLRIAGVDIGQDKPETMLSSVQCQNPGCHTINRQGAMFCTVCGMPLTEGAKSQLEQERAGIRADGQQYVRVDEVKKMIDAAVSAALNK